MQVVGSEVGRGGSSVIEAEMGPGAKNMAVQERIEELRHVLTDAYNCISSVRQELEPDKDCYKDSKASHYPLLSITERALRSVLGTSTAADKVDPSFPTIDSMERLNGVLTGVEVSLERIATKDKTFRANEAKVLGADITHALDVKESVAVDRAA